METHPGQQFRIDLCCADDATNLAHGFANGIEEAASDYHELDPPSRQRKVPDSSPITAMNAARHAPARWTKTKTLRVSDGDNGPAGVAKRTFHNKPGRHQTGAAKCLLHGADSPPREHHANPKLHQI